MRKISGVFGWRMAGNAGLRAVLVALVLTLPLAASAQQAATAPPCRQRAIIGDPGAPRRDDRRAQPRLYLARQTRAKQSGIGQAVAALLSELLGERCQRSFDSRAVWRAGRQLVEPCARGRRTDAAGRCQIGQHARHASRIGGDQHRVAAESTTGRLWRVRCGWRPTPDMRPRSTTTSGSRPKQRSGQKKKTLRRISARKLRRFSSARQRRW